MELFKQYQPIRSIYENDDEYICVLETGKSEPLTVFYNKLLKKYDELYWYEYSPADDIEMSKLIYGEELKF